MATSPAASEGDLPELRRSPPLAGRPAGTRSATTTNTTNTRHPISCERCKKHKSRCDRQRPSCRRCHDAQIPCEYADRRRPGFPAGYRQTLENKINQLEAEILALRSGGSRAAVSQQQQQQQRSPVSHMTSASAPTPSNINNADGDNALSLSQPQQQPQQQQQVLLATSQRTKLVAETKPPADLVCSLVALFFRHFHPWIPFLDASRVLSEMAWGDEPPLLCYALFSISLPFSFDSRLTRASSDGFWKYSKRRIFIEVLEEPSYASLEALTILVLDLSGMTHGPQVWGALAIAVKLAAQLKTSSDGRVLRTVTEDDDPQHDNTGSSSGDVGGTSSNDSRPVRLVDNELSRRRLFWTIYMLDCYITMTTSQPSQLAACHVPHFLPSREMTWTHDRNAERDDSSNTSSSPAISILSPTTIFYHQLRLMDISRDIHAVYLEYLTIRGGPEGGGGAGDTSNNNHNTCGDAEKWLQGTFECSTALDAWWNSLPDILIATLSTPGMWHHHHHHQSSSTATSALATLAAYYHALVIFLHGLIISSSPGTHHHHHHQPEGAIMSGESAAEPYRAMSAQKCAESIGSILSIIAAVSRQGSTSNNNYNNNGGGNGCSDKLGWPFSWSVWITARYALIAEQSTDGTCTAAMLPPGCLGTLMEFLEGAARHNQVSGKYLWLLRQAQEELLSMDAGGNGGAGGDASMVLMAPEPGSVLGSLLDLRLATSDLEDRFRCDPFFNEVVDTKSRQQQQQQQLLQHQHQSQLGQQQQQHFGHHHHGDLTQQSAADQQLILGSTGDESQSSQSITQDERQHQQQQLQMGFPLAAGGSADLWFSGPLYASSAFAPYFI